MIKYNLNEREERFAKWMGWIPSKYDNLAFVILVVGIIIASLI